MKTAGDGMRMLDPKTVRRSPFNREDFNEQELDELVKDVKERGVLQPGCVRPVRAGEIVDGVRIEWEIIYGERRWIAAARAGKPYPAIVRDVDDTEALELQAIENFKREDLNAMDEATKYAQITAAYQGGGLTATDAVLRIEERLARKKSTVYALLSLLKLPLEVQTAVRRGKLPKSHAELLGKIDDPKAAVKLMGEMLKPDRWDAGDGGILSFRDAKQAVDRAHEEQENLKEWQRQREKFIAARHLVLSDEDNRKVCPYGAHVSGNSGYVTADDGTSEFGDYSTWKKLMGKHAPDPILARSPQGKAVIVYDIGSAREAARKNGHKKSARPSGVGSSDKAAQERLKKKRVLYDLAVSEIVTREEKKGDSPEFWKFYVPALIAHAHSDALRLLRKRRGIKEEGRSEPVLAYAAKLNTRELRGLALELMLMDHAPSLYSDGFSSEIKGACKLHGVTLQVSGKPDETELAAEPLPAKNATPEGRAKLAAAMKARWAERKNRTGTK